MKKLLLSIMMLCSLSMNAQVNYDLNGDNKDDIEDLTYMINHLMGKKNPCDYESVDLGLSVKWATCNVGAEKPEDYGLYFAWGDTVGYKSRNSLSSLSSYIFYKQSDPVQVDDGPLYEYLTTGYTKYVTDSSHGYKGYVDNKSILDAEDDAATHFYGKRWHIPTESEWQELRNNCQWEWSTINGINGYKISSPNGNYIFLPATISSNQYSLYWSSELDLEDIPGDVSIDRDAYSLYFDSWGIYKYPKQRESGATVRPVYK